MSDLEASNPSNHFISALENELESTDTSAKNWIVLFRNTQNQLVLYNNYTQSFRTTTIARNINNDNIYLSFSYFHWLAKYYSSHFSNQLPPPLSEYLLNGYFDNFFYKREKIVSGGTSSVYHVWHRLANIDIAEYAVKVIPFGDFSRLRKVLNEVKLFQHLSLSRHPFIIGYYHCWIENFQPAFLGPKIPCLFILMEFSKIGNLETFFKKYQFKLDDKFKWKIFLQVLSALQYLHHQEIIHRDLKMSNILVLEDETNVNDMKYKFVLSDFGTTITANMQQNLKESYERTGATGTIETMAPELFEKTDGKYKYSHSFASDIWSIGIIFFNLFVGCNPFEKNGKKLLKNFSTLDNLLSHFSINKSNIPSDIYSLLGKMITVISQRCHSIDEIVNDEIVLKRIHEFNYENYFIFGNNTHSSKHFNNFSHIKNCSKIIPTSEELSQSIPLTIIYAQNNNLFCSYRISNLWKRKWKLYVILLCSVLCNNCRSLQEYFIHLVVSLIIVILSFIKIEFLFVLPIFCGYETLIGSSNSLFYILLIFVIIIFLVKS
ncbi:AGC family protein kinase [Tritrichomonas foetus]|uniref:AGC family protein kinase n=1 Tax=Tritrichomonas foetus TaxID=1144522 RepID=A0A1J4J202_9EUKA|nr:AGC family protein kinase [Tritrichomonas foetus]|eukprot:OHS92793.1 AGC family protein kinase [Tritrichomonas foetus]